MNKKFLILICIICLTNCSKTKDEAYYKTHSYEAQHLINSCNKSEVNNSSMQKECNDASEALKSNIDERKQTASNILGSDK